mmetsp:Transcript_103940/g.203856  ORF Transcript_103940/g.203856 Transcript_103940/m.203856 type:complete len:222 (+) Transcript_103940:461-1126(+)
MLRFPLLLLHLGLVLDLGQLLLHLFQFLLALGVLGFLLFHLCLGLGDGVDNTITNAGRTRCAAAATGARARCAAAFPAEVSGLGRRRFMRLARRISLRASRFGLCPRLGRFVAQAAKPLLLLLLLGLGLGELLAHALEGSPEAVVLHLCMPLPSVGVLVLHIVLVILGVFLEIRVHLSGLALNAARLGLEVMRVILPKELLVRLRVQSRVDLVHVAAAAEE